MLKHVGTALFLSAALALAGCAGTNFVRPDAADLSVGHSTYAQVIAKMGEPRSTGEALVNGEKVKSATYVYASTGGEPLEAGVIPARALGYYFFQDQLVGQEFLSSFKSDNSNFDDTKVPGIEKGKTTRAEVIALLGKPTGTYIKPMVKETSGEAFGYTYSTTSGSVFSGFKVFKKALRITFDSADHVLDVDYAASGTK
jgi:hypothetical protein